MTTFLASSNLANRLRTLAYTKRHCCDMLRDQAHDLDRAAQRHTLEPTRERMAELVVELSNARVLYAEVAGKPLTAD